VTLTGLAVYDRVPGYHSDFGSQIGQTFLAQAAEKIIRSLPAALEPFLPPIRPDLLINLAHR